MNEKILLEAVMLAGEEMLVSGAEVYRVEDTMNHMLRKSGYETVETIVFGTGIFLTLDDPNRESVTLTKRVPQRSTNVNRIYCVNDISRRFCDGELPIEEAYAELKALKTVVQYSPRLRFIGNIGVSMFFAPMFGGGVLEFFVSALVGGCLAFADWLLRRIKLNDFCVNAFCAFVVAVSATLFRLLLFPDVDVDVPIISAIMPLVPGVTFTTAIRDTLNGDYAAGSSRMMEAIVVALAVAVGVGGGLLFCRMLVGGTV
jgi:uncharacterized membrane protein YjjP (DUF1212 family)